MNTDGQMEYQEAFDDANNIALEKFEGYPKEQANRTIKAKKLFKGVQNSNEILFKMQKICYQKNDKTYKLQDLIHDYTTDKISLAEARNGLISLNVM